jgi:nitrate/nitrite transporter NarK
VYGTEIFPTHVRAKGLNIAASAGAIGSIVVAQIWPVAIQNIGARTYFIFFAINAVSVVILWFFYPETKGRTLEKMDALFEGGSGSEGDVEAVGGEKREEVGVREVPVADEKN